MTEYNEMKQELAELFGELFELFAELKEMLSFNVIAGIATAIVVIIIEGIVFRNYKPRDKKLEKAINLGHIIKADLVRSWDDHYDWSVRNFWYYGIYKYEVNGVSYEYHYKEKSSPPKQVNLYYVNNPRWPFIKKKRISLIFVLVYSALPFFAAATVIYLLGGV